MTRQAADGRLPKRGAGNARGFTGTTPGTSPSSHDWRRLAQQAPLEKMLGKRINPGWSGGVIHFGGKKADQLCIGVNRVEQPEMIG